MQHTYTLTSFGLRYTRRWRCATCGRVVWQDDDGALHVSIAGARVLHAGAHGVWAIEDDGGGDRDMPGGPDPEGPWKDI